MNGFDLAGRPIRVGLGNDKFTSESTQNLLQRFPNKEPGGIFQGSSFSGSGGRGTHAGGNNNFDRAGGREDKGASGASALDDTDVAGGLLTVDLCRCITANTDQSIFQPTLEMHS